MANERILVVEDESIVARDIQMSLRNLGYDVPSTAGTGADAIRLGGELKPDLIMMDIHLRGQMDGIEAAGIIRSSYDVPVIYLTAYADDETLERAKQTGPFGYLIKPFEERELVATIEMALYRHQLEQKLRESEERFATTLHSIGDAVIATDRRGCITFINPVAEQLTGWTAEDASNKPLTDVFNIVNELTGAPAVNPVEIVMREGRIVGLANHTALIARDGTHYPIEDSAAPIVDANGKVTGVVLVFHDLTERQRLEKQQQASHERLARVAETSADGILIVEEDGMISFANAAAERIFGLSRAKIQQRRHDDEAWQITKLDGQPFPSEEFPFHQARTKNEAVYGVEQVVSHPDGRRVVISVNAAPLLDGEQNVGVVKSITDITERKALEERLTHLAFHDPLTSLPNRALFINRLEHALTRAGRNHSEVSVLFIDLDNFKVINDSMGHGAGDILLKSVAKRLLRCMRHGDTVARFGGDEFVVLLDSFENPGYATRVVERILSCLEEPFDIEGREVFTSPSIGLAFNQDSHQPASEMLRNADTAMYEAKRQGKARYVIFQDNFSEAALRRMDLESDLRRALQNNEFVLHYQPKIALDGGELQGFEALVRWQHPTRGLVPPSEFIPIAEETGLIIALGKWVLREACQCAHEWHDNYPGKLPPSVSVNISASQLREKKLQFDMNVNVSAQQLKSPGLVNDVAEILRETGLPPASLVLELTESTIMEESETTVRVLHELKALGVRLAIDDFGTGYSSLAYLKSFPLDILKIDRKFVTGLHSEPDGSVIIGSMINLAHALRLQVVAEGTETDEEVECLRGLGCDQAQGYFFSRPMSGNDTETYLSS